MYKETKIRIRKLVKEGIITEMIWKQFVFVMILRRQ